MDLMVSSNLKVKIVFKVTYLFLDMVKMDWL